MAEPLIPTPTPQTQPFWDAAARGELFMQRSVQTGKFFFYPRGFVPGRVHETFEWAPVSGRGTLESYVINHRPLPGFEQESPVIALVRLHEGPRMMTNIVDVQPHPENLPVGAPVEVLFRPRGDVYLPFFRIVKESA